MSQILQTIQRQLFRYCTLPWAEQRRHLNANRAAVTKIKRNVFTRMYPVTLVNADGSTTRIKYSVPRILVKLPLDFDSLDENMQRKVRLLRQPKERKVEQKTVHVAFDPMKYAKK